MERYRLYEMEIILFNKKDNFADVVCFSENEGDIYDEFSIKPETSDI